jgi:hypothetical protein
MQAVKRGLIENVTKTPIEQGCQRFLGSTNQNGRNIPNNHSSFIPNGYEIYQMVTKNT